MGKKVTFNENLLVKEINATPETELEKIIACVTSLVIKELKNKNNIKSVLKKPSKDSVINKVTCTSTTTPKKAAPKKKRKKMTPLQKKKALEKKRKATAALIKKQKNRTPAEYTELLHIDKEQTSTA